MKILFISAANKNFDGRTRAILDVLNSFADVIEITTTQGDDFAENNSYYVNYRSYKEFIRKAVEIGKGQRDVDFIFADNRKATVPTLKLNKLIKPKAVIYDARELYLQRETHGFVSKIGCFFESRMLAKASLTVCANEERKEVMKREYGKIGAILVFENFRKLSYSEDYSEEVLNLKFDYLNNDDSFKIVSTAGCELERGTKELIEAAANLDFNNTLYLVGCKENTDKQEIEAFIEDKGIQNVKLVPRLNQNELKYFVSKCDAGIAMYHKKNSNNLYCSSGKVYEYAYEGIAVATTDNPPMRRILDEYGIGAYDSDIEKALISVHDNIDAIKENIKKFVENQVVEKKQEEFSVDLRKYMEDLQNGK
ncbi:glycosyltransferase [Mogibacterium timidum]|uniref:Glycosyltransferase, group 1 family protein n=1 Tax=Mogibacterium timidum ATCC 33093 TaxID=1401079 RepID=X8J883_9FIRM|nr:glycosyltransferase [Mogibacterium timidum]EUC58117.1 glycosyltransferase, group 1 family protein [Mogibacterium timidum ATCC 33093]